MKRFTTVICLFVFCLAFAGGVLAQGQATGIISGAVLDPDGKAVVGATVTVTDQVTNSVLANSKTNSDGRYTVADVAPGAYTVTIEMAGFKKSVTKDVTVITGRTYDLSSKLEIGATSVEVQVDTGGMQVMETQNTSTQGTVTGRAITNLPFESRSAVLLGVLDPGAQTVGGSRNSTFEGLPKGTINITFDGIANQDNLLKSSDGFFAENDPRIDDVEEFGITTTGNDPSKTGEGAVQMTYVSKRGGNSFHGGVWETNRNTDFNSNYYFNNLTGQPRQTVNLNEFGYKIGGPILKNRLFFFTDFDFFQFPQSVTRSRNILNPAAANGTFTYIPTTASAIASPGPWETCVTGPSPLCTVNLFGANGLAQNGVAGNPFPNAVNPVVASFLNPIEAAATAPGVTVSAAPPSSFQNTINFINSTQGVRRYPDFRLDYNLTKKDSLEFDYHYAWYDSAPDVLNNQDATYPIATFNTAAGLGSQLSNRSLFVLAWRRTIGSTMSNELRGGIQSAPINFGLGEAAGLFPTANTTFGMVSYTFTFPNEGLTGNPIISNPFHGLGSTSGRNPALGQIHDTFSWTKGTHQFQFGFDETDIHYNDFAAFSPAVNIGLDPNDPAVGLFAGSNLPSISSTDLTNIEAIYTGLTGRVNGYSSQTNFNPATRTFVPGFNSINKITKLELGFFGGDSWRVRPTLTFNYGLRWEYDGPTNDVYNQYYLASNFNDVFGISGPGNLFHPGATNGNGNLFYTNDAGKSIYNKYYRALAPSVGLAWQPSSENPWLKHVLGGPGKTVIRGGYSIAYSREGINSYFGVTEDNPGSVAAQFSNPGTSNSLANGTFTSGSLNLGAPFNFVAQTPTAFTPTFQLQPGSGSELNVFDPNIKPPMVESWNGGIQRELTSNMVLEVRYQGNHGVGLWDRYNLNETNIFENGFLNEFTNAQNNLNICLNVNPAGCLATELADGFVARGLIKATATKPVADFGNLGLPGQVNLPIMTAAFTPNLTSATLAAAEAGNTVAQQGSFFLNSGFVRDLNNQGAGALAASIGGSQSATSTGASTAAFNTFFANYTGAGFPANEFIVNPSVPGGAFITGNAASSTYNALIVDLRHRPSHGLQFDVNYSFAKSLTNYNANSSLNSQNFITLRNPEFQKGPAPFDTRHAIKGQVIYELPFGPNHWLHSNSGVVNRLIGGWEVNSITRFQTGQPVLISSALSGGNTFNNNDPGINLVGMTVNQIQSLLGTNKTEIVGAVAYVPTSLLTSNLKSANPAIFQPCNVAGSLCSRPFFTGPSFFRADISLVKTTKITERVNLEIRMEALNAFNDADFYWGCAVGTSPCTLSSQSTRFGQMGSNSTNGAYSDINTTQDPGGRIIQLIARVNF